MYNAKRTIPKKEMELVIFPFFILEMEKHIKYACYFGGDLYCVYLN